MNTFISCDWGTSAFRLRLIDAGTKKVLATIKTKQGIANTYNEWNNNPQQTDRVTFFSRVITEGVKALEQECHHSLANTTIVISGMASSSIGMIELPYKDLPFSMDGSNVLTKTIPPSADLRHTLLFISGAKTSEDVMRGEETKLLGCSISDTGAQLLILPGTHTKHIVVKEGVATSFKTYMTGELFDLLSTRSVLAASIDKGEEDSTGGNTAYFLKGVEEAAGNNMLNSIFHVRTFRLFKYHSPQQNYQYLSGLVIGSELKELLHNQYRNITLVSTGVLAPLYRQALQALGIQTDKEIDADDALIAGQTKVYLQSARQ